MQYTNYSDSLKDLFEVMPIFSSIWGVLLCQYNSTFFVALNAFYSYAIDSFKFYCAWP